MSGTRTHKARTATLATLLAAGLLASGAPGTPGTGTASAAPSAPGTPGAPGTPPVPAAPPAPAAPAAPAPDRSVSALLTDLQRLYREAGSATARYRATDEELSRRRDRVGTLQRRLADARGALHTSRGAAARLARQQYRGADSLSPYLRLLTARSPRQLLDERYILARVSQHRAAAVDRLTGSERTADGLASAARAALDEQQTLAARHREERDAVTGKLDEVERLLTSLTPEQLGRLGQLESAGAQAGTPREFVESGALAGPQAKSAAPSATGEAALRYAVGQIGKPYEWGAVGPTAFDCSGLTSKAWAAAGAGIPRTSQEQWNELRRVPLGALRPGDLVVYFPGATHVALYLGGGRVVQAPRPGAKVKVSPVAANPVLGAVRPDPDEPAMTGYRPPELPSGADAGSDAGYDSTTAP
ncbi:NlpC/P60 family protein [Streptomyces uncialis]|uniref:C40 family peptidase n=1 Tax=Streptomyces uncialis TaxID=1048205 RepID=UPI003866A9BE|nr:NlpC/P60 family protein [Streptomyces uncialis]